MASTALKHLPAALALSRLLELRDYEPFEAEAEDGGPL
jgi:hypothetical protein